MLTTRSWHTSRSESIPTEEKCFHAKKNSVSATLLDGLDWFMVFNATFNNISDIHVSWWYNVSFINGGNQSTQRKPSTCPCRKSLTNIITYCCIEYTSAVAMNRVLTHNKW